MQCHPTLLKHPNPTKRLKTVSRRPAHPMDSFKMTILDMRIDKRVISQCRMMNTSVVINCNDRLDVLLSLFVPLFLRSFHSTSNCLPRTGLLYS